MSSVNRPTLNLATAITTFRNFRHTISALGITPVQKVYPQIYMK